MMILYDFQIVALNYVNSSYDLMIFDPSRAPCLLGAKDEIFPGVFPGASIFSGGRWRQGCTVLAAAVRR